jgi:serine/threonine protein kinase
MGLVFKAQHQLMKRLVALKVIRPQWLSLPEAVGRFHREIEAAAKLSHPNIVIAHDASQDGNTHFFAMEYVEGMDLAHVLKKRGPLPIPAACNFVRQAALALQHAHERGLVHRDIKPSNLLLSVDGVQIKVLDMGLARLQFDRGDDRVKALTQMGAVMGTPDYIAPEQVIDSHRVDIRADIYSLGCTFYQLLTGQVPFPGKSLPQKLDQHLRVPPRPLESLRPDLPVAIVPVVRKMMAKRPEERYQVPAEVAAALASFAGAGPLPLPSGPRQPPSTANLAAEATEKLVSGRPALGARPPAKTAVRGPTHSSAPRHPAALAFQPASRKRLGWMVLTGIGAVLALAFLLWWVLRPGSPGGPLQKNGSDGNPVRDGEMALFNGNDLAGWEGLKQYWTMKGGVLVGSSFPTGIKCSTFLCSKRSYKDFELSFRVKLTGKGWSGNSGVQIRSKILDRQKFTVAGPQADMGEGYWGSLYGEAMPGGMMKAAFQDRVSKLLNRNGFNDYFIKCAGKHVMIQINGLTTVDDDFALMPGEGIIAFQLHRGEPMEVTFKSFHFKEPGQQEK